MTPSPATARVVAAPGGPPHHTGVRHPLVARIAAWLAGALLLGNAGVIVWMWVHGGGLSGLGDTGELMTSLSRITGLLSAYLALVQLLLMARVPVVERHLGFDRMAGWHRWVGHACLELVVAHVVLVIAGYAALDRIGFLHEVRTMTTTYPGMVTAWVGTGLFGAVVGTSLVIVRRRLRHEAWYAVHLMAYAGIALAWFHQVPTGNEFAMNPGPTRYWRALFYVTFGVLILFRLILPLVGAVRHRMRVAEVTVAGPGVVSVRITGRNLAGIGARPGQFFLWRFLDRRRWWAAHPFSLSEAPDGRSLRITVKALGDFSGALGGLAVGTRVMAEGPYGVFTADRRRGERLLLVGGGVGVTPIRAMLEDVPSDVVVIERAVRRDELVLHDEIADLAARRGAPLHTLIGDHRTPDGQRLTTPSHLRELVPDITAREVYLCGPPGMTAAFRTALRAAGVPRRAIHVERFAL